MSDNSGNNLLLLLAVLGVGVGVLIAPDKESNTRQKIKDKFDSSSEDVLEKLSSLVEGFKTHGQGLVSNIKKLLDGVNPVGKDVRKSMIELLEKKVRRFKKR